MEKVVSLSPNLGMVLHLVCWGLSCACFEADVPLEGCQSFTLSVQAGVELTVIDVFNCSFTDFNVGLSKLYSLENNAGVALCLNQDWELDRCGWLQSQSKTDGLRSGN